MKGIIFDFNGTLFFDSHMHYEAWRIFSKKLRGYEGKAFKERRKGYDLARFDRGYRRNDDRRGYKCDPALDKRRKGCAGERAGG